LRFQVLGKQLGKPIIELRAVVRYKIARGSIRESPCVTEGLGRTERGDRTKRHRSGEFGEPVRDYQKEEVPVFCFWLRAQYVHGDKLKGPACWEQLEETGPLPFGHSVLRAHCTVSDGFFDFLVHFPPIEPTAHRGIHFQHPRVGCDNGEVFQPEEKGLSDHGTTICLDPSRGAVRTKIPSSSTSMMPSLTRLILRASHSSSTACSCLISSRMIAWGTSSVSLTSLEGFITNRFSNRTSPLLKSGASRSPVTFSERLGSGTSWNMVTGRGIPGREGWGVETRGKG
jgi:hypothetical protein